MLDDALEAAISGDQSESAENALQERPRAKRAKPAAPSTDAPRRMRCVFYHDQAATRRCEGCDNYLCGAAVKKRTVNHELVEICPCEVGARVLPLTPQERGDKAASFETYLAAAFAYPLGGAGPIILLLGTPFFAAMYGLATLPYIGYGFAAVGSLYLVAYLVKVVFSTAMGDEDPPGWPEVGRWWESIVRPCLMVTACVLMCGSAAAAYGLVAWKLDPVFWGLAVLGSLFLPMAVACVSVDPTANGINPLQWLSNIITVPAEYVAAVLTLYVAVGLKMVAEMTFGQIPYVGLIFGVGIALYFLMVDMRVLGLIFHANRERLGW